jgi:hypothetical protein
MVRTTQSLPDPSITGVSLPKNHPHVSRHGAAAKTHIARQPGIGTVSRPRSLCRSLIHPAAAKQFGFARGPYRLLVRKNPVFRLMLLVNNFFSYLSALNKTGDI